MLDLNFYCGRGEYYTNHTCFNKNLPNKINFGDKKIKK